MPSVLFEHRGGVHAGSLCEKASSQTQALPRPLPGEARGPQAAMCLDELPSWLPEDPAIFF